MQDITSEISGGWSVKLGIIRIKYMRDCETEYKKLSKIPNYYGNPPPADIFTLIQDFFSAMKAANSKAYSDKETIDMDKSVKSAKFASKKYSNLAKRF